jgi:hypothetical protein
MQLRESSTTGGISRRTLSLVALGLGLSGTVRADCIDDAAAFQHVNVSLMRGIAQVESGMRPDRINVNSNGTTDIGLMQINSSWLPVLAKEGITEQSLFDPCTNAYVGAWILAANIRQFGPNWTAVGAYNAASPDKRLAYARKVYDAVQSISATPDSAMPILPPSFTPPQAQTQSQAYNPFASLAGAPAPVGRPRAGNPGGAPIGAAGAAAPAGNSGAAVAAAGAYNFGWTITGADQAKPIQVFDDGAKVFVQFSDMKQVPAIFGESPNGRVLLRWDLQFPYAVIARAERTLIFQMGPFEARATRATGTAPAAAVASTREAATSGGASSSAAVQKARAEPATRAGATDALWYALRPAAGSSTATAPSPLPAPVPQSVAAPSAQPAQTAQTAAPPSARTTSATDTFLYINAK